MFVVVLRIGSIGSRALDRILLLLLLFLLRVLRESHRDATSEILFKCYLKFSSSLETATVQGTHESGKRKGRRRAAAAAAHHTSQLHDDNSSNSRSHRGSIGRCSLTPLSITPINCRSRIVGALRQAVRSAEKEE
uniref:Putative secreted protein n=1 Tax=Anopheles darlingi TaxID=43151 RepID=A0A2M4D643_ANODA